MIDWYVYAFLSVILGTVFIVLRKKALCNVHAMNFESARSLSVAFFCLFLIPIVDFSIGRNTIFLIYTVSLLATTGVLLMSKALRHNEISLIYPLRSIKPAFVAILAFFFLGEAVSQIQIIGIIIILVAAYLLESDHHFKDFLKPIKNLVGSKYNLYFIGAVFLFSVSTIFDKFVLTNKADMFTYFFFNWIFIAINFNILHAIEFGYKDSFRCFKKIGHLPFLVGLLSMGGNLFALKALSMTYVSLVTPVLMIATLLVVLTGGEFFHEKYLLFRFITSLIMIFGVYLVII